MQILSSALKDFPDGICQIDLISSEILGESIFNLNLITLILKFFIMTYYQEMLDYYGSCFKSDSEIDTELISRLYIW